MDDTPLAPPAELNFVGTDNFAWVGQHFFDIFVRDGGLKPHHRVLDVGCGVGRMALPLTAYLAPPGGYEGIDIVDAGIDWCRANITPRFPHFRFRQADVYNGTYHPAGRYDARDYRFPYPTGSFDFAFLTSVFSHMLPADLENYLAEVARVLKVGGRCVITFFLRTPEAVRHCATGKPWMAFEHPLPGCWVANPASFEDAVAYEEPYVLGLYERLGLTPDGGVRYGSWSGRPDPYSGQDVLIATKTRHARPPAVVQLKRLVRRVRARWFPPARQTRPVSSLGGDVVRAREFSRGERAA
ncbi:MAG TPA: class I SAM-dependent methyltransferase [Gemmataceae bacterium]|jgi:SAM-dependent methyltransferase